MGDHFNFGTASPTPVNIIQNDDPSKLGTGDMKKGPSTRTVYLAVRDPPGTPGTPKQTPLHQQQPLPPMHNNVITLETFPQTTNTHHHQQQQQHMGLDGTLLLPQTDLAVTENDEPRVIVQTLFTENGGGEEVIHCTTSDLIPLSPGVGPQGLGQAHAKPCLPTEPVPFNQLSSHDAVNQPLIAQPTITTITQPLISLEPSDN